MKTVGGKGAGYVERETFDVLMRDTLKNRAEQASMSDARKEQIYQAVADCQTVSRQGNRALTDSGKETWPTVQAVSDCRKEEYFMRKSGKYRILVAAAALCIMGTMAVMAAGKIVGYSSSHSSNEPDFATYGDMAQAGERAGFPVKAPEKLANGYVFDKGFLIDVKDHDENGEVLESFPEVSVSYKKDGKDLTLNVERIRPEKEVSTTGNPRTVLYGDITMIYREDHYRFVPPEYQITEEEQKAVDAGELYVSYGSSEVEDKIMCFLEWEEGDIQYLLMSQGTDLGMEGMVEAGKQVIDSPEL